MEVTLAEGGTTRVEAEYYLIATGSSPWAPPIDGLHGVDHLTSTTAMELQALPESMLVIGGNYIGLEQSQLFARLGVQVTAVEMLDRLAPGEEPEVSEGIERVFADEGIAVHTGAVVTAARHTDRQVAVEIRRNDGTLVECTPTNSWWPPAGCRSPTG